MPKVNKIFKVDAWMIPVFTFLIITGFGIHISGESGNHHSWIIWSAFHVLCAVAFLILVYFHIRQHIGWFKTLLKGNVKGRGITITLATVMTFEIISGIILLVFVEGEGSILGHLHWVVGYILAIIGTVHYLKRFQRLKNGFIKH